MARLRFPDAASIDRVQATAGTALLSASGATARVYVDAAGTQLADIQNADASANATATLTLDSLSRLPVFLGPTSGAEVLYVRVDGGAPLEVEAVLGQRFTAQNATVTAALATFAPKGVVGDAQTAFGFEAGLNRTTGADNTAFGYQAARETTTGSQNTSLGRDALRTNITGNNNTAIGWKALSGAGTPINGCVGVGFGAGQSNQADNLTAIGASSAQQNTTGTQNTAVGSIALQNNQGGADNTAVGYGAAKAVLGAANTAVGNAALFGNGTAAVSGDNNVAIGSHTGRYLTTGADNTLVGTDTAATVATPMTTGSRNTVVGKEAAFTFTAQAGDTCAFGYRANVQGDGSIAVGSTAGATATAAIAIGRGATATAAGAVAIGRDSGGTAATATIANDFVLGTAAHRVRVLGTPRFEQHVVGAGTPLLGSNCPSPAPSLATPYAWFKIAANDGAVCVVPGWRFDA